MTPDLPYAGDFNPQRH